MALQVFAKGSARAGDELWVARYLLERVAEKHNYSINWHPKPLGPTDWNGVRAMRISVSNFRTTDADVERTLDAVRRVMAQTP